MNQFYNKDEALSSLIALRLSLRQDRVHEKNAIADLGAMFDAVNYHAIEAPGRGWRLAQGGVDALGQSIDEETVVAFQGIISAMDLPPFAEKIGVGSKQVKYLHQSLTLTALGNVMYGELVENIATVHGMFGRAVGPKALQPCSIWSYDDDGDVVIEMANRYFSPKRGSGSVAPSVDFTKDVDPYGYLSAIAGIDSVHTQDNAVLYYQRVKANDGSYDYIHTPPVCYQVGDIVEVQVSFALFPLRESKFKSALVLRSILLLDNTHTDKANVQTTSALLKQTKQQNSSPVRLKRRVGYGSSRLNTEDERISATRAKFQRMEIDSNVGNVRSENAIEGMD